MDHQDVPLRWSSIDLVALDEPGDPEPRRPGSGRWWWVAALVAVAVVAVGGRWDVGERRPQVRPGGGRDNELRTVGSLSTTPPRPNQASVRIDQASGPIPDGQLLRVSGNGFQPGAEVELRQCGAAQCTQLEPLEVSGEPGTYRSSFLADEIGTFTALVAVRRYLLDPMEARPIDCTVAACELVTVVYFTNRSLYPEPTALTFFGDGIVPGNPTVVADATSGLHDGQRVRVAGVGFEVGSTPHPALCSLSGQHCVELTAEPAPRPVGSDTVVQFTVSVPERSGALDCRRPRYCGLTIESSGGDGSQGTTPLPVSFAER